MCCVCVCVCVSAAICVQFMCTFTHGADVTMDSMMHAVRQTLFTKCAKVCVLSVCAVCVCWVCVLGVCAGCVCWVCVMTTPPPFPQFTPSLLSFLLPQLTP